MKHRFKHTCYNVGELLDGCDKLSTFMSRLTRQSEQNPDNWDPMTYRGDGFEAFVETLIALSPIDKRINITDYSPWNSSKHGTDMGVDGVGVSHNGQPHTVQAKFRSNTIKDLTANEDHISNFVAKTASMYPTQLVDMTIFTTGRSLHQGVNESMYHGRVRTLGYPELTKLVDDNPAFWRAFTSALTIDNSAG